MGVGLAWGIASTNLKPALTIEYQSDFQRDYVLSQNIPNYEKSDPDRLISDIINRLAKCESGSREDIKILDVNNEFSYGYLMFQKKTFDKFGSEFNLPHTDIMSKSQQVEIAKEMIRSGLFYHWKNCWTKLGLE